MANKTPHERLYSLWKDIKKRCYNPNFKFYNYYGGRGIHVCDEWLHNPNAFIEWSINNGYREGLQIDRIENDGPYAPTNCRFVTRLVNVRNRSDSTYITIGGETKQIGEWADSVGITAGALRFRVMRRWAESDLLLPLGSNPKQQRIITINGESKRLLEWSNLSGLSATTISDRIKRGWDESELLRPPTNRYAREAYVNNSN